MLVACRCVVKEVPVHVFVVRVNLDLILILSDTLVCKEPAVGSSHISLLDQTHSMHR